MQRKILSDINSIHNFAVLYKYRKCVSVMLMVANDSSSRQKG